MTTKTEAPKLATGIGKVSAAIAGVYGSLAKSGNIVTQVCKTCATVFRGKPATKAELKHVAENVARLQGWSDKSAGPRKSEVRKIVRNYLAMPEAVELVRRKTSTFSWHDAMRLATQLNNDGHNTRQAVKAYFNSTAKPKASAIRQLEAALKRAMSIDSEVVKIVGAQDARLEFCNKLGINCGYE